jgi:short-subunit dehydrogenase
VDVRGQRVLITGASYGIGAATARSFAARGAHVVVAARTRAALDELASDIGGHPLPVDLSLPSDVDGLLARAAALAGAPIDILVNNAGMTEIAPFATRSATAVAQELQVNLAATIELTRQALPGMLERQRGHLVFMSSLQASAPTPGFAVYGAAKAAVSHFAAILRLELAATPIDITVVAPGPVDTPMWERIEASPLTTALLRRYARAGLLTKDDPARLADKVVAAVARGTRHVRTPRRALLLNVLPEAPRRMTELLLTGVAFDTGATSTTPPQDDLAPS